MASALFGGMFSLRQYGSAKGTDYQAVLFGVVCYARQYGSVDRLAFGVGLIWGSCDTQDYKTHVGVNITKLFHISHTQNILILAGLALAWVSSEEVWYVRQYGNARDQSYLGGGM